MSTLKPRHNLSSIDLERKTAICSVCGATKLYVWSGPDQPRATIRCLNKIQITNRLAAQRRKEQRHLANPNLKPRHRVSHVDRETMIGVCSECGPTHVRFKISHNKKYAYYLCMQKVHARYKQEHRKRYVPRSRQYKPPPASIAQQQHRQLIEQHKLQHGCESCGYNAHSEDLELHFQDVDESQFAESLLMQLRRRRLLHALKISEVYCVKCHAALHREPVPAISHVREATAA